ncbi:MAG: transcription elongation factor subunit Spt4 [Candidatus Woesearchaeota archaeon]
MSKKKACKKCKLLVEGNVCPICKGDNFSTSWQGRLFVNDVNKSMIAEKIGVKVKGEYAIKVK